MSLNSAVCTFHNSGYNIQNFQLKDTCLLSSS
nr:unnamed protein product [Callosobruchus chinensis]